LVHKVIGREQNIESKMAKLAVGNKIDVEYQSTGTWIVRFVLLYEVVQRRNSLEVTT